MTRLTSFIVILLQFCDLSGTAEEGRRMKKSRANGNIVEPEQQLQRNHFNSQSNIPPGFLNPSVKEYLELGKSIPGRPGTDYPVLGEVPYTSFYCEDQEWPGFFADVDTRCQTWHYCDIDGRQATFLCPNGTQFSQALFICDWWFNVNCDLSPQFYFMNSRLYQKPALDPARPHRKITKDLIDRRVKFFRIPLSDQRLGVAKLSEETLNENKNKSEIYERRKHFVVYNKIRRWRFWKPQPSYLISFRSVRKNFV